MASSPEDAFLSLSLALGSCQHADALLAKLPQALQQFAKFDELAIAFVNAQGADTFEAQSLQGKKIWQGSMPSMGSSVHAAVDKGGPLTEAGIGKYSNYYDVRKLAEAGLASYAIFPLSCEGKIFATLNMASSSERAFSAEAVQRLSLASDYIAKHIYALLASEKARQQSTSSAIARVVPHIYLSLGDDFRLLVADGACQELLGYTSEELRGLRISNIVHSNDYKRLDSALRQLSSGAKVGGIDFTLLTKSGEHRRFELRGAKSNGRMDCVLLPAGEGMWGEQARFFSSIVDNSSDAIYTMDSFGVVRTWNKSAESLLGYASSEIVGTEAKRLFKGESTAELDEIIRKMREGHGIVSSKTERVRKGGQPVTVVSSASALVDDDGKTTGYMEVLRDLSSLVKLSEKDGELRRQQRENKELEGQKKDMGAFISDISHELRTPLTNIHGYTSLLKDGEAGKIDGQLKEFIDIIYGETDRMNRLITDVLDLSKLESRRFKFGPKLFDPRDLEEKCSCRAMAEKKGLYVKWEFDEKVEDVYADPQLAARILVNLISNAIKFTNEGGVTVKVKSKSASFVQFEVIDTGIGIPPEARSKLFKRFSQLSASGTRKEPGTGLGLAITRELVKMHGGKIDVKGEVGKGTTFAFTLHRAAPKRRA
jgi:PAS domain S-box-containing protein